MKLLIYIRSLISAVLFILLTVILAALGITSNIIFNRRKFDNWIMTSWGKSACFLFNVKVQISGLENLKKARGAIILFNHSSFMDVLAMCGYLNNIRFGAKIELFKIPFFGACMRRFGVLPIARNNREEVFKVYEEAKVRFAKGEKFGLSPEGGRFHGNELFNFKTGPFVFAITSGVPVIPLVIKGAYEVWPKGSMLANSDRWSRKVELHLLEPIETIDFTVETRSKLQDQVYQLMNNIYTQKP